MTTKLIKVLAVAVNALLIVDLTVDLWDKYKARKAAKTVPATEEEPATEEWKQAMWVTSLQSSKP